MLFAKIILLAFTALGVTATPVGLEAPKILEPIVAKSAEPNSLPRDVNPPSKRQIICNGIEDRQVGAGC